MLLFEHYVEPSPIHGLGVFSAMFIPNGSKVWEFHPAIDRVVPRTMFANLPEHVLQQVAMRSEYLSNEDAYMWGLDGDQFMNHSIDPNVQKIGSELFACRDIRIGDEITCDYREIVVPGFNPVDGLPHSGHFVS